MGEAITEDNAHHAFSLVRKICEEVGPGLPGTPQERERGEMLKRELETHLGAGNVVTEEFSLAPGALLSTYPGVISMVIAILLNLSTGHLGGMPLWITSAAALIFSIFPPLSFSLEFLLSLEVFDAFFPKKHSTNVIGTLRKPGTRDVKRVLILSGHHDSALENTWLYLNGYVFYILSAIFFIGMLTLVVVCLVQLVGIFNGNEAVARAGTLGWAPLVFLFAPSIIYALCLTRGVENGGVVPGAADNLSACAVVVEMARFLVQNPSYIPDGTEIRFISFGSEEAGLRGSRRYVKRHLTELKKQDIRMLNYEMIAHPVISILTSDVNGTLNYDPKMVKSVINAAQRAGVPYKSGAAGIGAGSDAAPFTRAGIKAATIQAFKLPEQQFAFYHQRRDTPDVLSLEPFINVLKLTLEWVRRRGE